MSNWSQIENAAKLAPKQAKKKPRRVKAPAPSKTRCTLYGLIGADGIVRYIGQTRTDLLTRLNYHKRNAFTGGASPVAQWIAANRADIAIIALDENATWDVSEILLIDRYRREGRHLWNVTRGGTDSIADVRREGCFPQSHEELRKIEQRKVAAARAKALGIDPIQPLPV